MPKFYKYIANLFSGFVVGIFQKQQKQQLVLISEKELCLLEGKILW